MPRLRGSRRRGQVVAGEVGELVEQAVLEVGAAGRGGCRRGLAVMPDLAAAAGGRVVAGGEPGLGEVSLLEVAAGAGAAHPGRYPAGVDGVADHAGKAVGDGQGEGGDEQLAVAVGLDAVPRSG